MDNNYVQKRKIVYKCSYCGTTYVNRDNCPSCDASTAESVAIADNLDNIIADDIVNERTQIIKKGSASVYLTITTIHLLSCTALIGFALSPIMLLVHLICHISKRKKPHPLVIIDGGFCLLLTVLIIIVLPDILS